MTKRGPTPRADWAWTDSGPGPDGDGRVYVNDLYVVIRREDPDGSGVLWLSIHRKNREALRDWRHLQRIKNELAGPEREAVEVFPAESRLVDTSNQYHLWVLPEGETVGVGFEERRVLDVGEGSSGSRQRPLA